MGQIFPTVKPAHLVIPVILVMYYALWGDMDDEYPGNDDLDSANDFGVIAFLFLDF